VIIVYIQNLTFLTSLEKYTRRLRYDLFSHIIRQVNFYFYFIIFIMIIFI